VERLSQARKVRAVKLVRREAIIGRREAKEGQLRPMAMAYRRSVSSSPPPDEIDSANRSREQGESRRLRHHGHVSANTRLPNENATIGGNVSNVDEIDSHQIDSVRDKYLLQIVDSRSVPVHGGFTIFSR
jgi:hypothetical protein